VGSSLLETSHKEKESRMSQSQILSLEQELVHELTNDKNINTSRSLDLSQFGLSSEILELVKRDHSLKFEFYLMNVSAFNKVTDTLISYC
jgi:hypothetical protein